MREKKKWDYKWVIAGACFLMVLISLGFCSSNRSLYLAAITEALEIKRGAFAVTDTFRFLSTSIINIFFGTLIAKFGVKKMIGTGFASLIISTLIYAHASSLWLFYLGGCFLGIGLAFSTTAMVGCVVKRWFHEHTGKVMGAILAANGVGGALAAQIVTPMIYAEGDPFGYRSAYRLIAVILAVTAVAVLLLIREKAPASPDQKADAAEKGGQADPSGIDFRTAVHTPRFYFVLGSIFFTGLVLQGINSMAATHMKDVGLDAGYVALVLSIYSLALTGCKFLTGFLYDRYGLRTTALLADAATVLTVLLLYFLTNSPAGKVMAMVYAFVSALAMPLETIMLPLFAMGIFGGKDYDKILGIFVSFSTAGMALGAPLINGFYDAFSSYRPMLIIYAGIMLCIMAGFRFVVKPSAGKKA